MKTQEKMLFDILKETVSYQIDPKKLFDASEKFFKKESLNVSFSGLHQKIGTDIFYWNIENNITKRALVFSCTENYICINMYLNFEVEHMIIFKWNHISLYKPNIFNQKEKDEKHLCEKFILKYSCLYKDDANIFHLKKEESSGVSIFLSQERLSLLADFLNKKDE